MLFGSKSRISPFGNGFVWNGNVVVYNGIIIVRFVEIVKQLLHSGKLDMLAEKPKEQNLSSIDGFYDDQFYYFLPENLYEKVKKVFYSSNIYSPLNLDQAIKALAEEGIIALLPNGYGKKTYYARIPLGDNKKRSFIKIRKEILQRIAES